MATNSTTRANNRTNVGRHHPAAQAGPTAHSIRADEILPKAAAMRVLGWGEKAWNRARRQGLKVLCFGSRSYVTGAEIIRFLQSQQPVERHGGPGRPDLVARRQAKDAAGEKAASDPSKGDASRCQL